MDTNTNDMDVRLGIFGLGGFGSNLVHQHATMYSPGDFPGRYLFVANTDRALLHSQYPEVAEGTLEEWRQAGRLHTMILENPALSGGKRIWGAGTKPDVGRQAAEAMVEKIKEYITEQKLDVGLILSGMGKGTGQGSGPVFAQALNDVEIPVFAMGVTPFLDDGPLVYDRAVTGIKALRKHAPTIMFQNEQIITDRRLSNLSMKRSWEELNELCIMGPLLMFTSLLQKPSNVNNMDLADILRVCEDGNTAAIGYWTEEKEGVPPEEIVHALITGQLQDPLIIRQCRTALIQFRGSFSPVEQAQVKRAMRERMHEDGRIEIIYGTDDSDGPDAPRTIGFFAATEWDNLAEQVELSELKVPRRKRRIFKRETANTVPVPPVKEIPLAAAASATTTETASSTPPPIVAVLAADKGIQTQTASVPPVAKEVARESVALSVRIDGKSRTIIPSRVDSDRWKILVNKGKPTDDERAEFVELWERLSRLSPIHGAMIEVPEKYAKDATVEGFKSATNGNGRGVFAVVRAKYNQLVASSARDNS